MKNLKFRKMHKKSRGFTIHDNIEQISLKTTTMSSNSFSFTTDLHYETIRTTWRIKGFPELRETLRATKKTYFDSPEFGVDGNGPKFCLRLYHTKKSGGGMPNATAEQVRHA